MSFGSFFMHGLRYDSGTEMSRCITYNPCSWASIIGPRSIICQLDVSHMPSKALQLAAANSITITIKVSPTVTFLRKCLREMTVGDA